MSREPTSDSMREDHLHQVIMGLSKENERLRDKASKSFGHGFLLGEVIIMVSIFLYIVVDRIFF